MRNKWHGAWSALCVSFFLPLGLNAAAPILASAATLKICKVAGDRVDIGTSFDFDVDGVPVSVPAGPPPGGFCQVAGSDYQEGSTLTVKETGPRGYSVIDIDVNPPSQLSGVVDLPGKLVDVIIGAGVTEVTFTNENQTGFLEICKEGSVGGEFEFTVADIDGIVGTFTIPAGVCTPPIQVTAGDISIIESAIAGMSMGSCSTLPDAGDQISCSGWTSVVNVTAGDTSTQTIAIIENQSDIAFGSLEIIKTFAPGSAPPPANAMFDVAVNCTNPVSTTTWTLTPGVTSILQSSIPVGSSCSIAELPPDPAVLPPNCTWDAPVYSNGQTVVVNTVAVHPWFVENNITCTQPGSIELSKGIVAGDAFTSSNYSGLVDQFNDPSWPSYATTFYSFDVACTPAVNPSMIQVTQAGGVVPSISVGSTCVITEFPPTAALPSNCSWGAPIFQPSNPIIVTGPFTLVSVENPITCSPQPASLEIEKLKLTPGFCHGASPPPGSGLPNPNHCEFQITITNTGMSPYSGPITVDDWVILGTSAPAVTAPVISVSGGWICTGSPIVSCTNPSVWIPVGGSISFTLVLDIQAPAPAEENCAEIAPPLPESQTSCVPFSDPPPVLTIEKRLLEPCTLDPGGASDCTFEIIIRNIGAGLFDGPITVLDGFNNNPGQTPGSAFNPLSPDWTCAWNGQVGSEWTALCETAPGFDIQIPPGGFYTLLLNIRGPAAVIENCASLEIPAQTPKPKNCVGEPPPP